MVDADKWLTIRRARLADVDAIVQITREAYREYVDRIHPPFRALNQTRDDVREDIAHHHYVYGMALWRGEPAGHIRHRKTRGYLHISRLAVVPRYRGHGIGRFLMAWVEEEALRLKLRRIRGEARSVQKELLAYYESMGYETVGQAALEGIPHCLTILEKHLIYPAPNEEIFLLPDEDWEDDAPGGIDTSDGEDAVVSIDLLHPALDELLGLSIHRSTKDSR